ncbi:hypothetical protein IQ259_06610 [Fortiea sp. LEGE XX443]|uniref:hypothetical protein n=1 Tax=Fortiea sp. LEGE XX443 TaxID=1828611 RepID=UPI001A06C249|nr:hypothetical protein [Fortiea sp. LEGE XX443]
MAESKLSAIYQLVKYAPQGRKMRSPDICNYYSVGKLLFYPFHSEKSRGAGSRGEKPPTRGGASLRDATRTTKGEKEQGGFCPQGARFLPFPLPPASNK